MPRPSHNNKKNSATQRMEDAFWQLLAEREYRTITIVDIVRTAKVNRNSFYYHYTGLADLATQAIGHVVTAVPSRLKYEGNTPEQLAQTLSEAIQTPEQCRRMEKLTLLAGPHSSPELQEMLHQYQRMVLADIMHIDLEHINRKTNILLDFAAGGLISVLGRWPVITQPKRDKGELEQDIAAIASGIYMSASSEDMLDYWKRIFQDNDSHTGTAKTSQDDAKESSR